MFCIKFGFSCSRLWNRNGIRMPKRWQIRRGIGGTASPAPPTVFSRKRKWLQKDRVASSSLQSMTYQYLHDAITERTFERLEDIEEENRNFPHIADIGSRLNTHHFNRLHQLVGATHIHQIHSSAPTLEVDEKISNEIKDQEGCSVSIQRLLCDEENLDDLALPGQFDLIISNMSLHWVNDLPGVFRQILHMLKPNGVFLGSLFGGRTLQELRDSFLVADQERFGGASLRISPFAGVADCGNLLSTAGFALPTVDADPLKVHYPDALALMDELREMGEQSAVKIPAPLKRDTLLAATAAYQALYQNEDGTIPATFDCIFMIGWKPDPTQPKPKARGSAQHSLADALQMKPLPSE